VPTAFVVGGTSAVGRAIAQSLLAAGWDVTVASRSSSPDLPAVRVVHVDRDEDGALLAAVGHGVDLLVDVIPFEVRHAQQLLAVDAGAVVAISSASVYADDEGRTLDEAQFSDDFPDLPVPIPETQRTVEPADETYSTKKRALELVLLGNGRVPATIIRPCAVYGRGDRLGREWFFVKRALDRRPFVVLTGRGGSVFHTTAAENIGELVRLAAAQRRTDVFNCGDPDPPTVLEIVRRICAAVGHDWAEVLLPRPGARGDVGQTPWSVAKPLVVDMSKAEAELGYRPVTTWSNAIDGQVAWLVETTRGRDWKDALPNGADYLRFDYGAEDDLVSAVVDSKP
jgi:nucleoside-diphosphate-sugar epimerase